MSALGWKIVAWSNWEKIPHFWLVQWNLLCWHDSLGLVFTVMQGGEYKVGSGSPSITLVDINLYSFYNNPITHSIKRDHSFVFQNILTDKSSKGKSGLDSFYLPLQNKTIVNAWCTFKIQGIKIIYILQYKYIIFIFNLAL